MTNNYDLFYHSEDNTFIDYYLDSPLPEVGSTVYLLGRMVEVLAVEDHCSGHKFRKKITVKW